MTQISKKFELNDSLKIITIKMMININNNNNNSQLCISRFYHEPFPFTPF